MTQLTTRFTDMTREQFQAHLDERSVNTHDAARVATFFSENGIQRRVPTGETATGRDAIRSAMEELFAAFPDVHLEVSDLFSTENRMCVQCTITGTHEGDFGGLPPTRRRMEYDVCLLFRFGDDGLVEEEIVYWDGATMLRQLGVLPEV